MSPDRFSCHLIVDTERHIGSRHRGKGVGAAAVHEHVSQEQEFVMTIRIIDEHEHEHEATHWAISTTTPNNKTTINSTMKNYSYLHVHDAIFLKASKHKTHLRLLSELVEHKTLLLTSVHSFIMYMYICNCR